MGFVSVSALTSPWIAGCEKLGRRRIVGTGGRDDVLETSLTSWWCTLASEFGPLGGDPLQATGEASLDTNP